MTLTRAHFRWLLAAYFALWVVGFAVEEITEPQIPALVRTLEPSWVPETLLIRIACLVGLLTLLGAGIVGLVGMFRFWSASRYIFLGFALVKILISPLIAPWTVTTGWAMLFEEIGLLLEGGILALCLIGPARHLFAP